jgi:alpha-beta hydrolase superfamily lysophospholipase
MLQSSGQISNTPTTTAIIYDSLPGKLELGPALAAFLAPIRSLFFRALMSIPLTIIYYVLYAIALIRRQRPIFEQMREELNQARILPWTNKKTPRLYIYSDTDKMVQQRAVEEHIAEAKGLGFNIKAEYFKGSSHVSHVRLDADRYWAAVKDIWEEAANN